MEPCNKVSFLKYNAFPSTLFFWGFYDSQLTNASLMEMQISYLSKTENAFLKTLAGGAESTLAFAYLGEKLLPMKLWDKSVYLMLGYK